MIERKCKLCGKIFKTHNSWVKRGRGIYCSLKCKHSDTPYPSSAIKKLENLREKGLMKFRKRRKSIEKHCKICNRIFFAYSSQIKKGLKLLYCSPKCSKLVIKKCLLCGNTISNASLNRKYCGNHKDINTCSGEVAYLVRKLASMKDRCYNKKNHYHKNYYNHKIFGDWLKNSFSFVMWSINNGWKKELEIDRIDNNEGYYPENCRYVTRSVNMRNTSKVSTNWDNKTRRCRVCKKIKSFADIAVSRKEVGGISYECKICRKEIDRLRYLRTKSTK